MAQRDNDGWATLGENEKMYFPLWPKKEFADICISDEWINYYSESIDLEEFLDDWIEGLKKDGVQITIMWNDGKGIEVELEQLKRDIERELEKY